jgi:hypothetical protein
LSPNLDFFLFDKERKLRQHHRDLQVENSDVSKIGFVYYSEESKPIARIVSEEPGQSIHAFLTSQSDIEPHNHAYHSEAIQDLTPDNSTRARLLQDLMEDPLTPQTIVEGSVMISNIKRRITRIIANDWNLVLCQMRQTLDNIDSKTCDNDGLRKNVVAWRRLLCTWRVNIIEYLSKLPEAYRLADCPGPNSDVKRSPKRGRTVKTGTQRRRSTASTSSLGDVELDDEEAKRFSRLAPP